MSDIDTYRARARAFLETHAPTYGRDARRGLSEPEDLAMGRRWQAVKHDAGYTAISWAKDKGGQGLGHLEKLAFDQEEMKHGFPTVYFSVSLGMPVPIMLKYLDPAWAVPRARAALRGEEIWCQLFSEPSAGSDLAGLRLRAEREGDTWVLNGQKLWTSWAHMSDYGVIVTRTDPTVPKHRGLTYFWLDMKAPGITVRQVRLADSSDHVNEVFFDDVRIPDSQRMGAVGGGFGVAMETLMIERYQATDPAGFGPGLEHFVALARDVEVNARPAIEDGRVRQQIARNYAMRNALKAITRRALLAMEKGMEPGPEGSLNKLVSVRSRQRLSELAIDLMGPSAIGFDPEALRTEDWTTSWLDAPTGRIAGGADEMLLNTIAERILGLPQDYRPDKAVPFNQIA